MLFSGLKQKIDLSKIQLSKNDLDLSITILSKLKA